MHKKDKPVILVTSATSAQGITVIKSLLREGDFAVRCLTRNANSQKALQLSKLNVEVVEAVPGDPQSLRNALDGCYGVFGATNYWKHSDKEIKQGIHLIEAIAQSKIQHFIFSSQPDYNKLSGGRYYVPHIDEKASLEVLAKNYGLPATFVHIAFYYENFLGFFKPRLNSDGNYVFGFPMGDARLEAVSIQDVGPVVSAVFSNPARYIGRTVNIIGDNKNCYEYANIMSRISEESYLYEYIPREQYAALDFPGAEDLANMFEVQRCYTRDNTIGLKECRVLHPFIQTFEDWLQAKNKLFLTGTYKAGGELLKEF